MAIWTGTANGRQGLPVCRVDWCRAEKIIQRTALWSIILRREISGVILSQDSDAVWSFVVGFDLSEEVGIYNPISETPDIHLQVPRSLSFSYLFPKHTHHISITSKLTPKLPVALTANQYQNWREGRPYMPGYLTWRYSHLLFIQASYLSVPGSFYRTYGPSS